MAEIEFEFRDEEEEGGQSVQFETFSQAVLWGTDWTVETVLAQLQRGNIELNPRSQRRDAWSRSAKSRFIESVILGLPVPQVVLAESREQRGRYIILDGKQRLLSLMQYAGYAQGPTNGFSLSGIDVRTDLARKRYRHLAKDPSLRPDLDAFLTHTIRTVVIRNWPSIAFLHVVFQRLNTGSLKLSPQELRQALAPGPFTDSVDDATIESAETAILLGRSGPDPRMRDVELLVRAISFRLRIAFYGGRMKEFLDQSCVYFNKNWSSEQSRIQCAIDSFKIGVNALVEVFGEGGIARKEGSLLFNRSIFDALIFYAMEPDVCVAMTQSAAQVRHAYEGVLADERFKVAVESDTAGIPHTADRLQLWGEALGMALGRKLAIPDVRENVEGHQRFFVC